MCPYPAQGSFVRALIGQHTMTTVDLQWRTYAAGDYRILATLRNPFSGDIYIGSGDDGPPPVGYLFDGMCAAAAELLDLIIQESPPLMSLEDPKALETLDAWIAMDILRGNGPRIELSGPAERFARPPLAQVWLAADVGPEDTI